MKVKKENLGKASKKIWCSQEKVLVLICSQEMDSVLFLVSQNFRVHQRILYWFKSNGNFANWVDLLVELDREGSVSVSAGLFTYLQLC